MGSKEIITYLQSVKPKYEKEGLSIIGLFGSCANNTNNKYSDIDIAYHIDYDTFSKHYKDGFSKILRIEEIKEELQNNFKTKVDFVPDTNKSLLKNIVYV